MEGASHAVGDEVDYNDPVGDHSPGCYVEWKFLWCAEKKSHTANQLHSEEGLKEAIMNLK